jgi:hypothetical protein
LIEVTYRALIHVLVERTEHEVSSAIRAAIVDAGRNGCRLNGCERPDVERVIPPIFVKGSDAELLCKSEKELAGFTFCECAETIWQNPRTHCVCSLRVPPQTRVLNVGPKELATLLGPYNPLAEHASRINP